MIRKKSSLNFAKFSFSEISNTKKWGFPATNLSAVSEMLYKSSFNKLQTNFVFLLYFG